MAIQQKHRQVLGMALSENIKKRREERKLSQEYLAEQLGVSRQAVSKWETGQSEPTAGNLIRLAEVLQLSLSELVQPEQSGEKPSAAEAEPEKKKANPILRANLIRIAITVHVAFWYNCTSLISQLRRPDLPDRGLYRGALVISFVLLALSSIWMASNHRYETDAKQRRKNANIELGYCGVQLLAGLLTIHFDMGLVGAVIMIAVGSAYILYVNPRFMSRRLTK